jgi:hypothetical protein
MQGKDPLPNENVLIGRKVAKICNNSLAELGVSLIRQTKQQAKEFNSVVVSAMNKIDFSKNLNFNFDHLFSSQTSCQVDFLLVLKFDLD